MSTKSSSWAADIKSDLCDYNRLGLINIRPAQRLVRTLPLTCDSGPAYLCRPFAPDLLDDRGPRPGYATSQRAECARKLSSGFIGSSRRLGKPLPTSNARSDLRMAAECPAPLVANPATALLLLRPTHLRATPRRFGVHEGLLATSPSARSSRNRCFFWRGGEEVYSHASQVGSPRFALRMGIF